MSAQDQAEEGGQQKGEKDRFQCTVSESDEERPGGVSRRGMRGAGEAAGLRDLEGDGGGVGMRVQEHSYGVPELDHAIYWPICRIWAQLKGHFAPTSFA